MAKRTKRILLAAALLLLAACAKKEHSAEQIPAELPAAARETDTEDVHEVPALPYCVKLVNDTLSLYEYADGAEVPVKSITIDTEYYPYDDISALKDGIGAYTKEDGYEILENFAN